MFWNAPGEAVANRTPRDLETVASKRYADGELFIGHSAREAAAGRKPFHVAITFHGSYGSVGAWGTEDEARAHGNRIHAHVKRYGNLPGWANAPR